MKSQIEIIPINSIHLLRAFAALLIINSHSDKLFPSGFSGLATGGSIGNAIFLFTSGYTLSLGLRKNYSEYLPWLKKRIVRLYPSFLIFTFLSCVIFDQSYQWFDWMFFNGSWFLQAILLYYFIFFPIVKYCDNNLILLMLFTYTVFILLFCLSFNRFNWIIDVMDNPTKIHWVYYFMIMIFGAVVAKYEKELGIVDEIKNGKINLTTILIFLLITTLFFYSPKLLFSKFKVTTYIQLVYPILLIAVTLAFYLTSIKVTSYLNKFERSRINKFIIFCANLTLDIYIVHFPIIHTIRDDKILFPINYLLAVLLTIFFAFLLNKLSNWFIQFLFKSR